MIVRSCISTAPRCRKRVALVLVLCLATGWLAPSRTLAQEPPAPATLPAPTQSTPHRLPAPVSSTHQIQLKDRDLKFIATAGSIPIANGQGRLIGEIAYVAFERDGQEPRRRPVAFAFNGGPGAASSWLNIGAMGPWRLPLTPQTAEHPQSARLVGNDETWLDFADLVFLDPVGTGFSRMISAEPEPRRANQHARTTGRGHRKRQRPGRREDGGPQWFWSVTGDIDSLTDAIIAWLDRHDRRSSPKILVGESYGGFRVPRIARRLWQREKMRVAALVLVSPVLDFDRRRRWRRRAAFYFPALLPSIAATQMELAAQAPTRSALAAVETYARSAYPEKLRLARHDQATAERMETKVAELTRLPIEIVRHNGGRLGAKAYLRAATQLGHRVGSAYDAAAVGYPMRGKPGAANAPDPFITGLIGPLEKAMTEIKVGRLGWRVARDYKLQSRYVIQSWNWGSAPVETTSALIDGLTSARPSHALITHGYSDLVTPYFETVTLLEGLPQKTIGRRLQFRVYRGGHMFYSRDASRAALRHDAAQLIAQAINQQG